MVFGIFAKAFASYPPSLNFKDVVCASDEIALAQVHQKAPGEIAHSIFDFAVVKNIVGNS